MTAQPVFKQPKEAQPSPSLTIFFTNDTDHKIRSGSLITDISDHFPNFVSIKGHRYQNVTKSINKNIRPFKPDNIKGFKKHLANGNWDFVNTDDNPETSYIKIIDKTTELLNPLSFKISQSI